MWIFVQVAKIAQTRLLDTVIFVYTINKMQYEFDPAKDESNLEKHGVSLADADEFEWEAAVVRVISLRKANSREVKSYAET